MVLVSAVLMFLGFLWNSRNVSLFQVQMFLSFLHTQSTNYECDRMTIKPIVCSCMPWKPCLCMFCFHNVQCRHTIKEQSYCHHHHRKKNMPINSSRVDRFTCYVLAASWAVTTHPCVTGVLSRAELTILHKHCNPLWKQNFYYHVCSHCSAICSK